MYRGINMNVLICSLDVFLSCFCDIMYWYAHFYIGVLNLGPAVCQKEMDKYKTGQGSQNKSDALQMITNS